MNNIVIIGGDKRQKELYKILSEQGFRCRHIWSYDDFDENKSIRKNDVTVLPVPVSKDGENIYSSDGDFSVKINDVFDKLDITNLVFGGNIPKVAKAYMKEKGIAFFDYLECEELNIYNAYLTGLGAVKLVLENSDSDIKGKKTLITGYGKVARFTAQELLNAGCDVHVSARNNLQLTEAECSGCKVIDFAQKNSYLYLFDYIINTVPENIFSFSDVSHIKGKYFELASAPFGVKKEYFVGCEKKYVDGRALPGRYLPYSAAEKLAEITVKHITSRNGGD